MSIEIVKRGEVPDATEIERMTYDGFRSKYGYDDFTDTQDQRHARFMKFSIGGGL